MYELMYLQFGRQRQRELVREAERERLVKEAKSTRKKRANRHWTSSLGWELKRRSRARKTAD